MIYFNKNIRHLRLRNDFTQQELADRIKVKRNAYESWENRNVIPNHDLIIKLGKVFKISLHDLCFTDIKATLFGKLKPTATI